MKINRIAGNTTVEFSFAKRHESVFLIAVYEYQRKNKRCQFKLTRQWAHDKRLCAFGTPIADEIIAEPTAAEIEEALGQYRAQIVYGGIDK